MKVSDAKKRRASRAWMISKIMEEKERLAQLRLNEIDNEQPALREIYQEYLRLYQLHIKPLSPKVDRYLSNIHERRKIEHFLQRQKEKVNIIRLPYAGPSAVGHPPKKVKALTHDTAREVMQKLKQLDPKTFADLIKQIKG